MTTVSDLTFGVEIECNAVGSMEDTRDVIRAVGSLAEADAYRHAARNAPGTWLVKRDGSLGREGREVVSPILRGPEGLAELHRVVSALQRAGHTADRSCGIHVHVGIAPFSPRECAAIATRYARHGRAIASTLAPSRSSNRYCAMPDAGHTQRAFESLPESIALASVGYAMGLGSKYHTVNLATLTRGAVEFRQHQGSVNPDRIASWVRFLLAFVIESVRCVREPVASGVTTVRAPLDLFRPGTQLAEIYARLLAGQTLVLDNLAVELGTTVAKARTQVFNVVRHLKGRGGVSTAALVTRTGRRGASTTFTLTGVSSAARSSVVWSDWLAGVDAADADERRARQAHFAGRTP